MHPAFSVIFFTVFSGAGYGLLALLAALAGLGLLPMTPSLGLAGLGIGFAAVSAGLLASTWHLGHPERAWRAFSQWRTSWLSREGVLAVLTFVPILLLVHAWIVAGETPLLALWALLTVAGAAATVACTGMIYQSLTTIHQWHNAWTVPNYLLLAMAGGGVWLNSILALIGEDQSVAGELTMLALGAAWIGKLTYWRFIDGTQHAATPETATGLGRFGTVAEFERPHSEDNYLMKEMGCRVARKHAGKLRRYAQVLAFALPLVLVATTMVVDGGAAVAAGVTAAVSATCGLLIERWLFFAEAKHVVTLFYGAATA